MNRSYSRYHSPASTAMRRRGSSPWMDKKKKDQSDSSLSRFITTQGEMRHFLVNINRRNPAPSTDFHTTSSYQISSSQKTQDTSSSPHSAMPQHSDIILSQISHGSIIRDQTIWVKCPMCGEVVNSVQSRAINMPASLQQWMHLCSACALKFNTPS